MRSQKVLLVLAACVALGSIASCQKAVDTAGLAADEQAIRDLVTRWNTLIVAKDVAGVAGLYAADGTMLAPNVPIAQGTAAISEVWKGLFASPGLSLVITPAEVKTAASRDLAYERGTYALAMNDPAAGPVTDKGKYVVVWKKVGDEWKVAADTFNSDLAAPAAATQPPAVTAPAAEPVPGT